MSLKNVNRLKQDRSTRGQLVLVEDDAAVRSVLTVLLESAGWEVLEAADGSAGLALARKTSPDVVVTDLRMPGLSGIELAAQLASTPNGSDVPVVAITSDSSDLHGAAVRCGHFATVMTKPLAPDDFLETVREAATPAG